MASGKSRTLARLSALRRRSLEKKTALWLAASNSVIERQRTREMHQAVAPQHENLIQLDPADALAFAGDPAGFHLIDTTMMYAPRSGGVKRYLMAKRGWLGRRRPDVRHTLVVPGALEPSYGG